MNTKKKILLVDDEEEVRNVYSTLLCALDYMVVTAEDGDEALTKAKTFDFDVIIADIKMPRLDGIKFFLQLLKERPSFGNRIIFMSGDDSVIEQYPQLSRHFEKNFIQKPFKFEELINKVKNIA